MPIITSSLPAGRALLSLLLHCRTDGARDLERAMQERPAHAGGPPEFGSKKSIHWKGADDAGGCVCRVRVRASRGASQRSRGRW